MAPGNKDHQVATRCAIGVFVPLIMVVLLAALTARAGAAFALPLAPGSRDHRGGRRLLAGRFLVTPLALISTLLVLPAAPGILLRDRIPDTVIGAAVGIAVVLAPIAWRRLRARRPAPTPAA